MENVQNIYIYICICVDIDTYIWCFVYECTYVCIYIYILCILNSDIKETKICWSFPEYKCKPETKKNKNCDLHFPTFTKQSAAWLHYYVWPNRPGTQAFAEPESCLLHLFVQTFFQGTKVEPLFQKKEEAETTKNRSIIDLNSFVKGRKIERICPGFWWKTWSISDSK